MRKANVGAGPNLFLDGWINTDREDMSSYIAFLRTTGDLSQMPEWQARLARRLQAGEDLAFRVHDLRNGLPFATSSVDRIYLGQVIEHLNPVYEAPQLLAECHRVLRPGGVLRIATPDLDVLIVDYVNSLAAARGDDVRPNRTLQDLAHEQPAFYKDALPSDQLAYILYGASGPKSTWDHYEGHMHLYAERSLTAALRRAGFENEVRFYRPDDPRSGDPVLREEVHDTGVSHSLFCDATR